MTAANGDGVVTAQERDIVVDNREAWGEILDSPCMGSCQVLPRLIRTYQAVPLGTPDVERNLGKLTELLREHSGANNGASFHMLLEGALELDEKEEDVFGRGRFCYGSPKLLVLGNECGFTCTVVGLGVNKKDERERRRQKRGL